MRLAIAIVALAACKQAEPAPEKLPTPGEPITIELDTAPGVSDLAIDPAGRLWAVAERERTLYRIALERDQVRELTAFSIAGIPEDADLEALAWTGETFALGTESTGDTADLWWAALDGAAVAVTLAQTFESQPDRPITDNHGIESLGTVGDDLVVIGFETATTVDGLRTAEVEVLDRVSPANAGVVGRWQIALTSETGKLADVDCVDDGHGGIECLGIERHFEVTRLVRFALPGLTGRGPIPAHVERDLGELAKGRNFEGIARLPDGRIVLVNDNQYRGIDGPTQLVILPASQP